MLLRTVLYQKDRLNEPNYCLSLPYVLLDLTVTKEASWNQPLSYFNQYISIFTNFCICCNSSSILYVAKRSQNWE